MSLSDLVNSNSGRIMISIILGLGISTLFQRVCHDKNCIVIKAPPTNTIINKTFKQNNKCFQYTPESTQCVGDIVN